jgi:hypothetical protein
MKDAAERDGMVRIGSDRVSIIQSFLARHLAVPLFLLVKMLEPIRHP